MEKRQESLIEHLEALRSTLIKCFAALGIGLLPMFLAAPDCIDLLIRIMTSGNNISLNYFSPMEVFVLQIKTAVVLDILICSPYIAKIFGNSSCRHFTTTNAVSSGPSSCLPAYYSSLAHCFASFLSCPCW